MAGSTPWKAATVMAAGGRRETKRRQGKRQILRNLVRAVSGVSFPLAGSVVVIYTLSGDTRKVAIGATLLAVTGHVTHSMMELADGRDDVEDSDASTANRMVE